MTERTHKRLLEGHRAVITGASSGIGEEYARQLAALGADLVVAARRIDRLEALCGSLSTKYGVKAWAVPCDLTEPDAAARLFSAATADGGRVTILINNAGIGPYSLFLDEPVDRHLATLQLNTVALTELCHRFAMHMREHGRTSYITNIGSIASFQGAICFAVYAGTKTYVRIFSQILRRELRHTNVRVTCVCPGGVQTEFLAANGQVLKDAGRGMMMSAEQVVRDAIRAMLAGRAVLVPGWLNQLATFLPRLLPSGLALAIAERAMARSVSKAK